MTDPEASSAAARLSRARWGSTRTDRLVSELAQRREQLTDQHAAVLRALVAEREGNDD